MAEVITNAGELTAAELLTFGILPPVPGKPEPVKPRGPQALDEAATVRTCNDPDVSKG